MASSTAKPGRYPPVLWGNGGNNFLAGLPEIVADPLTGPPHDLMSDASQFSSFDHSSLDHIPEPFLFMFSPGYTQPNRDLALELPEMGSLSQEAPIAGSFGGYHGPPNTQPPSPDRTKSAASNPTQAGINPGMLLANTHLARPDHQRRRRPIRPKARGRRHTPQHVGILKCEWKDCPYTGIFSRKGELQRHVNTQHIAPNSFECPEPGCNKTFNRKDNMEQHLNRVHFDDDDDDEGYSQS